MTSIPQKSASVIIPVRLSFIFIVLLSINLIAPSALAQSNTLIVQDTTLSTMVINTSYPQSAAIVLYSPFPHLNIQSSIELRDSRVDMQKGEYVLTAQPNTEHLVTLQYPGFESFELQIPPMEAGHTKAFTVQPADSLISGTLTIEPAPTDAMVEVDGLTMGEGAIQLYLPEGAYPVRISKEGYDPIDFSAQVSFENPAFHRRTLQLVRQPLTVVSNVDGASIFLNGTNVGATPLRNFMVDQGFVEIRIERTGYTNFEQVVDIRNDQQNLVDATLERVIQLIPSSQGNVQNETLFIENDTLRIQYELSTMRPWHRYRVEVSFLGQDNAPIEVSGLAGDIGKGQVPGKLRTVYWPIPEDFPLEGLKVQVNATSYVNPLWLVAGGVGIGGGITVGLLTGSGTTDSGQEDGVVGTPPGRPGEP